jgi:hypothetical protein
MAVVLMIVVFLLAIGKLFGGKAAAWVALVVVALYALAHL